MKKLSKITLQDKVVLGDTEMRYIMGGTGATTGATTGGIICELNARHDDCKDKESACEYNGWAPGKYGMCKFSATTGVGEYHAKCECEN